VHEESDLCLRMAEAGRTCAVLNRRLVWHKGSSAFKRSGRRAQRYYDARNLLWLLVRRRAARRRGRRLPASLAVFARYMWHRYSHEREHGEHDTSRALLEGLHDGIFRHAGPMTSRRRRGVDVAHRLLGWLADRRASGSGPAVAAS
jgi:GT2 family glycosyltransferase